MNQIPNSISLLFIATTVLAVYLGYRAFNRSRTFLLISSLLLALEWTLARIGIFADTSAIPPRLPLLMVPILLFLGYLLYHPSGKQRIDSQDAGRLTLIHLVRIPVEFGLLQLALHGAVPFSMTFEGYNMDLFSGISAGIIYWLAYRKNRLSKHGLLAWNLICLGLVANVAIRAMFAVPTPFQQWDFEQPNVGVLYAPFIWLPGYIVPLVLYSQLATIGKLLREKKRRNQSNDAETSHLPAVQY